MFLFTLISCEKSGVEHLFETDPETRVSDTLKFIKNELTSAEYGWKVGLATGDKGGYGFYMKFDENDQVSMLSDFSEESATDMLTSTFRLSFNFFASLVFDTYNYITLMHDPVPGVAGGSAGTGYKSDIEYSFVRARGDSLIFAGKKYKHPLIMVKANKQEQEAYLNGGLYDFEKSFKDFYNDNYQFAYLGEEGQLRYAIELNYDGKEIQVSQINADSGIDTVFSIPYYNTPFSIELIQDLEWENETIKSFKIGSKDAVDAIFDNQNKTELKSQLLPLYDITEVFAYNKNFRKMTWSNIPDVQEQNHVFNEVNDLFAATGRTISEMYFEFTNSTTARVYVAYATTASSFSAAVTYKYRLEEDKLFIKYDDHNGNWNTRSAQVAPVNNLFGIGDKNDEREFRIEWTSSADKSVKVPIGAIRSVDNPTDLLYGELDR